MCSIKQPKSEPMPAHLCKTSLLLVCGDLLLAAGPDVMVSFILSLVIMQAAEHKSMYNAVAALRAL